MVTVSEQYNLEQDVKKYRIMNNEKNFEIKQLKSDLELKVMDYKEARKQIYDLKQKLEKVKELAKVFQREEWGDCRYIRKIICGKLNKILDSQEKE